MKLTFRFTEGDIITRSVCSCCKNNKFRVLSTVSALSSDDKLTSYLETSICTECTHIERTKILSEEWMFNMFEYRDMEQVKQGFSPINDNVEKFRCERYKNIGLAIIAEFPGKRTEEIKLIDIGCGTGTGLKAWMDLGLNAMGIEPDISRARFGLAQGIKIETFTWQDFDFNEHSNNVYTSIQSLEHFYDAESLISCIFNNMKNDSILYIEVPDAMNHIMDWQDSLYLGHVHNFSENSITFLLRRLGFNSIKRIYPYKDDKLNRNNICVLARKEHNSWGLEINNWDKDSICDYVRQKIRDSTKMLPVKVDMKKIVHYRINEINDLMLSFKSSPTIKPTVKDNQQACTIIPIGQNYFEIGSSDQSI